jgi:hypothetical protein
MIIHEDDVTIRDATTGEMIRELTIDPTRTCTWSPNLLIQPVAAVHAG